MSTFEFRAWALSVFVIVVILAIAASRGGAS